MKYGIARILDIYSVSHEKGEQLLAMGGDYMQAQLWSGKHLQNLDSDLREVYESYLWAYFCMKRLNKLEEYGVSTDLSQKTLEEMANDVTVFLDRVDDSKLPLASTKPQKK